MTNYDPSTPRCGTCLYFKRRRLHPGMTTVQQRRTKKGVIRVKVLEKRDHVNPMVWICQFGNFETTNVGLCDEWRTTDGERLDV